MSYSDYNLGKSQIIVPTSDRVYSDLDLSLTKHPAFNDITPLTDTDAVKNSVRNLLLTNKGDRPFQPTVGSNITHQLFENANPFVYETIRQNIKDMLNSFEPRINSVRVQLQEEIDENSVHVTVTFNVTNVENEQTVDFYLERLR